MTKICLINVWIGKLPDSFFLWRMTAEENSTIDFLIITDQKGMKNSGNIRFIEMSFDEIRNRFQRLFPFRIKLNSAYKLCDYKPLFGYAFQDLIGQCDFWGHCDLDILLGDVRSFITKDVLQKYDKIFETGFFSLYRNNEEMKYLYQKSDYKDNMAYSYKQVFTCNYACYFDEYMGMNILGWKYCNNKVLRDQETERIEQDFSWQKLEFQSYITGETFLLQWKDGKVFRYICNQNGEIIDNEPQEFLLVHVQKRKMEIGFSQQDVLKRREFWIVPNKYVLNRPNSALYSEYEKKKYARYIKLKDKKRSMMNLRKYGLIDYIPHYFRSRKIRKWIVNEKKFF